MSEEKDPHGKDAHETGSKLDDGKLFASLVLGDFANALTEVCKIGTFGAIKYTKSGWLDVPDAINRYEDAMMRHWLAMQTGETHCPDSGELHMSHFTWNALAVLELKVKDAK